MTATVTRRSLARAGTVSALAILVADSAMRKRIPSPGVAVAQDEPTVAVAMLDRHAEKLEPLFDTYSEQAGIDVEITPFEYEDLYRQASLALTQQASTFDVVSLQDAWIPQFASLLSPFDYAVVPSEQIIPVATELTRYPAESQPCGVPWLGDAQFFVSRIQ